MTRLLPLLLLLASCGDAPPDGAAGHGHEPLYGGVLVEIGDHFANVELVFDAREGRLDLYSLDAHAEEHVRLTAEAIDCVLALDGEEVRLRLRPVASALSGERPGDTAHFAAQADRLRGRTRVEGRIERLETMGQAFASIPFAAATVLGSAGR